MTVVTSMNQLQVLVERAVASPRYLASSGFTSCLCDEIWMRRHSSPVEFDEYESVRRSYVEEIIYSSDPANILMSDPGEYDWRTPVFAEKVKERYEKYGAVAELFSDRAKRHLIYLTQVQQRLSIALEKGSSSAIEASNERLGVCRKERESEIGRHHAHILKIKDGMGECNKSEIGSSFISLLQAEIDGVQLLVDNSKNMDGVAALLPFCGGNMKVAMSVDCDPASKCRGRIFVDIYLGDKIVFFARALPSRFDSYKSYNDELELAICLLAWTEILRFTVS